MSMLLVAFVAFVPPQIIGYMYSVGIPQLELYFVLFNVVLFLSLQAFILFGFPLYYAQDKKSHMTGFQILLYALMWMVVLMSAVVLISAQFFAAKPFDLDSFQQLQNVEVQDTVSTDASTDVESTEEASVTTEEVAQ